MSKQPTLLANCSTWCQKSCSLPYYFTFSTSSTKNGPQCHRNNAKYARAFAFKGFSVSYQLRGWLGKILIPLSLILSTHHILSYSYTLSLTDRQTDTNTHILLFLLQVCRLLRCLLFIIGVTNWNVYIPKMLDRQDEEILLYSALK